MQGPSPYLGAEAVTGHFGEPRTPLFDFCLRGAHCAPGNQACEASDSTFYVLCVRKEETRGDRFRNKFRAARNDNSVAEREGQKLGLGVHDENITRHDHEVSFPILVSFAAKAQMMATKLKWASPPTSSLRFTVRMLLYARG